MSVSIQEARIAKVKVKDLLARRVNLQRVLAGIGIGRVGDDYAVRINVSELVPDGDIPHSVDGVPVELVNVGTIQKRNAF
jgi:hypothetical protein